MPVGGNTGGIVVPKQVTNQCSVCKSNFGLLVAVSGLIVKALDSQPSQTQNVSSFNKVFLAVCETVQNWH